MCSSETMNYDDNQLVLLNCFVNKLKGHDVYNFTQTVVNTFYNLGTWHPEAMGEGGLSRLYIEQLLLETRLDLVLSAYVTPET